MQAQQPEYIAALHDLVDRWRPAGVRSFADGTELIGNIASRSPNTFLHRLFAPLSEDEIDQLQQRIPMELPESLRIFYRFHNGAEFFDTVSVYGLRRSWDRTDIDAMQCNPFDLFVPAVAYRRLSPSGDGVAVNMYDDHSYVLVEPDGSVVRVPSRSAPAVLNRWPSFEAWLTSECDRLAPHFDENGDCTAARLELAPMPRVAPSPPPPARASVLAKLSSFLTRGRR